jgi:hypothetical protein
MAKIREGQIVSFNLEPGTHGGLWELITGHSSAEWAETDLRKFAAKGKVPQIAIAVQSLKVIRPAKGEE